jgi:hypothetical protein
MKIQSDISFLLMLRVKSSVKVRIVMLFSVQYDWNHWLVNEKGSNHASLRVNFFSIIQE